jgi:hypothetical protein
MMAFRPTLFGLAGIFAGCILYTMPANGAPIFSEEEIAVEVLNPNLAGTYRAILRTPPQNEKSHIGIFVMHAFGGSANNHVCTGLAVRGYTMLCADTEFMGREGTYIGYEEHAPAITAGIEYLRENTPGITTVLLYGRSMGAPMMTFYANVQENGVAACRDPRRIIACDTENLLDEAGNLKLEPVDGLILGDAHLGDALATFTYMDPAVTDHAAPRSRERSLDMYAAENGYPGDEQAAAPHFSGAHYNAEFLERFLDAQALRNAKVLNEALELWARIEAGDRELYSDGMLMTVPGVEDAARIFQADLDLLRCTKRAQIFLTRDGRQDLSDGPVCSVRIPSARFARADSVSSMAHIPLRAWLGARALRTTALYRQTENDLTGIDYESSNTSTVANVRGITKPLLLVANSGHYFIVPNEIVFDSAASADKTFAVTEGAVHAGTPCRNCAEALGLPPDYYGDTLGRAFDFIDEWIAARF